MIIEHWIDDGTSDCGVSAAFVNHENRGDLAVLINDCPIHCCNIEGKDWNDCMTKYHEHMGWEPYRPMDDDNEEQKG